MTTQVSSVISRIQDVLQDSTGVRWPDAELRRWLSDGQREVVIQRPEAGVVNGNFQLTASQSKQSIAAVAGAFRLNDVIRNMGTGSTPGRAVRLVQREILDAQQPTWHSSTVAAEVVHYVYDQRDPLTFYVYPRPATNLFVEIAYCKAPDEITGATSNIGIPDIYSSVLTDYVLYRAYTKDSEFAGNAQRAVAHYQAFANALGIKAQQDVASGPAANSPLNPNSPN